MKALYKAVIAACLVASAAACSTDSLEIEQQGVLTTNEYTTANDSGVEAFIAAVYAEIRGDGYQAVLGGGPACYKSFQYEMSRMGGDDANYYQYMESADAGTYSYLWRYYYRTIYWCNMIIENVPSNNVASTAVKNQVIAEARAIRAIEMMYLVQLYGNPPLADHIMEGTEVNTPAEESWAFIEKELSEAAESLPSKSGLGGQAAIGGRITKEAAYAYLGKAYLWEKKYSEAASTLYNKVIATGKYALYEDYSTYSSSKADFSDENIWEFDFNEGTEVANAQEGCFDLACFSPGVTYWYSKWAPLLMAWNMNATPSTDFVNFLAAHDGTQSERYTATIMDCPTASMNGMLSSPISNCDGYFNMKECCLAEDCLGVFPYYYSCRNLVYMRYAEVLLNYAEAVAEGGTAGSMSGLEALNIVRRRAGLEDAPALDMNNTTYGVKAERRAELYDEGHRFIDLVRWGDAATVLKDCGKEMHTTSLLYPMEMYGMTFYFGQEIIVSQTGGPGFVSGKNELFPIPTNEINNNPSLKQNPGW